MKKRTTFYDETDAPAPLRVKKQILTTIEIIDDDIFESSVERTFNPDGMRELFQWKKIKANDGS